MSRAYISAQLTDELRIKSIRDYMAAVLKGDRFYERKDPHITVVPPFDVKEGHESDVISLIEDCPLIGREVQINTLGVYEHIHHPYVVLLDVDVEIDDVRERLMDELPKHTKRDLIDPVRPHITLLKTGSWWDGADEELKKRIQYEIMIQKSFRDTEISDVVVKFKD